MALAQDMGNLRRDVENQHQHRVELMTSLREEVGRIARLTRQTLADNHRAMVAEAREGRHARRTTLAGLRKDVAELRVATVQRIAREKKELADNQAQLRQARRSRLDTLRGEVSDVRVQTLDTLDAFHEARTQTARADRSLRHATIEGIQQKVTGLKNQWQGELSEIRRDQHASAVQGGMERKAFKAVIIREVDDLRRTVTSSLAAFADELSDAHDNWSARSPASTEANILHEPPHTLVDAVSSPAEQESDAVPSESVAGRDDLTLIDGIGHGIQRRLHAAGILTFGQLLASPVDQVREIVGGKVRNPDVEAWLAQARKLTEGRPE